MRLTYNVINKRNYANNFYKARVEIKVNFIVK